MGFLLFLLRLQHLHYITPLDRHSLPNIIRNITQSIIKRDDCPGFPKKTYDWFNSRFGVSNIYFAVQRRFNGSLKKQTDMSHLPVNTL